MNFPRAVQSCELLPLFEDCSGRLVLHHIINRAKTRSSPELRRATEVPELLAWTCLRCSNTKRDDTRAARRFLLHKRGQQYGFAHMEVLIRALPAKIPMTLDELVGAMEWEPPRVVQP